MTERILTLHPQGKQGVNIERSKYDAVRTAIVQTLQESTGLTFTELTEAVRQRLEGCFDGSINWYVTTVKLDMEARGQVKRVGARPQRLVLTSGP